MPWKLVPPRPPKTFNYYVRGKYLGIRLDHSTGTADGEAAKRILSTWRKQAERGEFRLGDKAEQQKPTTFLKAAVAYMQAGGARKGVKKILDKWGEKPLTEIDQIAIDTLAAELYPTRPASTRNRQVYTPVSSILKHVGIKMEINRPKGWQGKKSTSWLEPEAAFTLFKAADRVEPEFGLFCRFLVYTGMRLGEALGVELQHVKIDRSFVYLPDSKNGEPRGCHLPPDLVRWLREQPPRVEKPLIVRGQKGFIKGGGGRPMVDAGMPFLERAPDAKLFRFHAGGHLRDMLKAALAEAGLRFPRRQRGFHLFCHTYGSWMHRWGKLDTHGLTRTGRWADPDSADRYVHTAESEEARRSDLLPVPPRGQLVEMKAKVS